jgi:hypothetical protein
MIRIQPQYPLLVFSPTTFEAGLPYAICLLIFTIAPPKKRIIYPPLLELASTFKQQYSL